MSPRAPSKEALLERAAARVANDDAFVASALREYGGGSLDLDAVAAFFGCARASVVRLALCRRPADASFREDVSRIAEHTGLDVTRLLGLLREAGSIAAFRRSGGGQLLAAARDDRDPKKNGEP